jgi:hypothetical protein
MSNFNTKENFLPFWEQFRNLPLFCGFTELKRPVGIDGIFGIAEKSTAGRLGNYEQAVAIKQPYIGLSLLNPIEVEKDYFLVCIDFDWKNAPDYKADPIQLKLIGELASLNCAYETSLSGHGCHYWVTMQKSEIPKVINLPNQCQIEFFSGFVGQKKNILLTDWDSTGYLQRLNVNAILPNRDNNSDIKAVLSCIPPEDYQEWISIGMIIKKEYKDNGYEIWDEWSRKSPKYDPFIMRSKWESFKGDGLSIGTLNKIAYQYGFEGKLGTINEDFAQEIINAETGEITIKPKPYSLEYRKLQIPSTMSAPKWVVDGIIPTGVGIIAGSAGVGKTTAIVPLSAIVAGFQSHLSSVKSKVKRKVIYITEDDSQVFRLLYGIQKCLTTNDGKKHTIEEIGGWFHIYSSKRVTHSQLRDTLHEAFNRHLGEIDAKSGKVQVPPLVVIDTAAANLDIENENDNAQISRFMAVLKEVHSQTEMPIWVIAHLTKMAKGVDIDNLDTLSARGGGAWEADANWTAILSTDKDTDQRIFKMNKRRVELEFAEILFDSIAHEEWVEDYLGDVVPVAYRYVTPYQSDSNMRIAKKMQFKEGEILKTIEELEYPSANEIAKEHGGNRQFNMELITAMIEKGILIKEPLPRTNLKKGRLDYIKFSGSASTKPLENIRADFA